MSNSLTDEARAFFARNEFYQLYSDIAFGRQHKDATEKVAELMAKFAEDRIKNFVSDIQKESEHRRWKGDYDRYPEIIQTVQEKTVPVVRRNSCNMHQDCDEADRLQKELGRAPLIHCSVEDCEDCYGK